MKLSYSEIEKIKSYFSDKPVQRAYLFGSAARDETTYNSDVDILVELDYNQHIGLGFVKMHQELEELLHKEIDLISEKALSKLIRPFVDTDKQLIYER